MEPVKIGIIGLGSMGAVHAQYLRAGQVPAGTLQAVCDVDPRRADWALENLGPDVPFYDNADAMLAKESLDGVIIATTHVLHPPLAIKAFQKGLHVLIEKPAGVYTRQVREMNAAALQGGKVFGIMYNQRTNPVYQKVRDLVQGGELGSLKRCIWIITNWYRAQSYYDSSAWRATWRGEGGGVLLNQAPHQLDLWQWICGMPRRVTCFMAFGKYHTIEVEDDVTAHVEYENGATGLFVTSTGEAPGTNRLELSGDMGKLVVEDGRLTFWRNRVSERKFNAEYRGSFGAPECWKCDIPVQGQETGHAGITANWVNAIRTGAPLLAPGLEGINGLMLSNAMHLSAWTGQWVPLPVDEDLYVRELNRRIQASANPRPR